MQVELKNIVVNLSQSLSSHCFTATLWVDGHPCFDVKDEGYGEPILYYPLASSGIELDMLIDYFSHQSPSISSNKNHYQYLDKAMIALVDRHIMSMKTKHQLRRITFEHGSHLYELADFMTSDELAIARLKKTSWWNVNNHVLNTLPFDEAMMLLYQYQFRVSLYHFDDQQSPHT